MTVADKIVELLRAAPDREWSPKLLASEMKVRDGTVNPARRQLRYAGKIEWNSLRLMPSMMMDVSGPPTPATPLAPAVAAPPRASTAPLQATVEHAVAAPAEVVGALASATEAPPLREQIERAFLAEPVDALTLLRRRWPDLLDEMVLQSRSAGQSLAETLREVIEGGLTMRTINGGLE